MINSFFPKGGLIAPADNANVGSGRIATLKPVLYPSSPQTPFSVRASEHASRATTVM